jgi:hypothetical protein
MTTREDMTVTKITEEAFTAAMRAAVAERGADYVFPGFEDEVSRAEGWRDEAGMCQYRNSADEPACLIGLALHKIDPALVPPHGAVKGADLVLGELGAPYALQIAASEAQDTQDGGQPWGLALAAYSEVLAERAAA